MILTSSSSYFSQWRKSVSLADAAAVEMALRQLHAPAQRLELRDVLRLHALLLLTQHVARAP